MIVVRYADDLVLGFQYRTEAERFLRDFQERLAKFGLELHVDKTRLIESGRLAARDREQRERENQRPSRSWVSPTSVGSARATELSSSGGLRRRSEWSRSSKPSRPSSSAGGIIVRPRSVHGFARLCWTTNTIQFRVTRLSCASSVVAFADCGGAWRLPDCLADVRYHAAAEQYPLAGISSASRSGLRESFARPETAHFTF